LGSAVPALALAAQCPRVSSTRRCSGLRCSRTAKHFPLIAVRIRQPELVLACVAAAELHLVPGCQASGLDASADRHDVARGLHLQAEVRERASRGARIHQHFIENEMGRRRFEVELGVATTDPAAVVALVVEEDGVDGVASQ
jgi:hypothetical protein